MLRRSAMIGGLTKHLKVALMTIGSACLCACAGEDTTFGPGEASASETRAISEAAEMLDAPSEQSLPQSVGDTGPNPAQ